MKKFSGKNCSLLCRALLELRNEEECRALLDDLFTVSERNAMEQRLEVAMSLRDGLIYQDILKKTSASSATISRVNRCLQYGAGGYEEILPRLEETWQKMKEEDSENG